MSIIRNIRIAMSADTKGFIKPVADVTTTLNKFNSTAVKTKTSLEGLNFAAVGAKFGAGFAAIGAGLSSLKAMSGFLAKGVKNAADLGETMSKASNVFGAETDKIVAQADYLAKAFGKPKGAIIDAASTFGLLGKGVGQTQAQAANMSQRMVQLAVDAESFHNVPLNVALERLQAAIRGEAEPMSKFGVLLNEAAVKAEALRMGLIKTGQEMDAQAKVAARVSLIEKGMADSEGDLFETQDMVMGQWRKLTGAIDNFSTTVGTMLLPALLKGVEYLNLFMAAGEKAFEGQKSLVTSWAETFESAIDKVGSFLLNFGDYWELAKISATQQIANIFVAVQTFATNVGIAFEYAGRVIVTKLTDAAVAVQSLFANLGHNIGEYMFAAFHALTTGEWVEPVTKPLLEGFKQTAIDGPKFIKAAFVDLSDDMNEVLDRIAGRNQARVAAAAKKAAPAAAVEKKALGGGAEADKEKKKKEKKEKAADTGAAALEFGSTEAASAIAKFFNRTAEDKNARETAKNTQDTVKELKRINGAGAGNPAVPRGPFPIGP